MTVGIYTLHWEDDIEKVYVGQSIDIHTRYRAHSRLLESGTHSNYKLQDKYNESKVLPTLSIIEKCVPSSLDDLEIFWTKELSALTDGLSVVEAGPAGRGLYHSNSKYTKATILKVFSLLYRTTITYKAVSVRVGVPIYLVNNIASGCHHLWLNEEYPLQFSQMLLNKPIRQGKNRKSLSITNKELPNLVSPTGVVYYNIENIAEFCRSVPELANSAESTRSNIGKVIKGTKPSHKGWKLYIPK